MCGPSLTLIFHNFQPNHVGVCLTFEELTSTLPSRTKLVQWIPGQQQPSFKEIMIRYIQFRIFYSIRRYCLILFLDRNGEFTIGNINFSFVVNFTCFTRRWPYMLYVALTSLSTYI